MQYSYKTFVFFCFFLLFLQTGNRISFKLGLSHSPVGITGLRSEMNSTLYRHIQHWKSTPVNEELSCRGKKKKKKLMSLWLDYIKGKRETVSVVSVYRQVSLKGMLVHHAFVSTREDFRFIIFFSILLITIKRWYSIWFLLLPFKMLLLLQVLLLLLTAAPCCCSYGIP